MRELELYKLVLTEDNDHKVALADKLRWVSEDELCVWVSYSWISEFIESIRNIFGEAIFDYGAFDGNFQFDGVCLSLQEILKGYDINLKKIFPIEKYQS